MNKEIRWKQRFENFEKAFAALERTVAIEQPSEAGGFQVGSPREVLKQAFQSEIIQDGHVWMEALDDRNLAAHTYNEETALKIDRLIRGKYFPALSALHETLKSEAKQ